MMVVEGEREEGDVKFYFERLQDGKLPKSNKCEQEGRRGPNFGHFVRT